MYCFDAGKVADTQFIPGTKYRDRNMGGVLYGLFNLNIFVSVKI